MLVLTFTPDSFVLIDGTITLTYLGVLDGMHHFSILGAGVAAASSDGTDQLPSGSRYSVDLHEEVIIDHRIKVTVTRFDKGSVRIAFDAPRDIPILRDKLLTCPHCGSGNQIWLNQLTGKPTCHRVGCNNREI